jgi:uncharacterized protein YegL
MRAQIVSVASPSHRMESSEAGVRVDGGCYITKTRYSGHTTDLDRDLVVLVETEDPGRPQVMLERGDSGGDEGGDGSTVLLLSLAPRFISTAQSSELVFLVDCSSSMQGESIRLASEALQLFLHSLPVDSYFNIVCFGTSYHALFTPESRRYDDESLAAAKQVARRLTANRGGTEIYEPLERVLRQRLMAGRPRQVFILTDGEVTNAEACFNLVRRYRNTNRVFTLGVGEAADHLLVQGLASAGQGTAAMAASGESLAPIVLQQLRAALKPCLHDVCIDWGRSRCSCDRGAGGVTVGGVSGSMLAEAEQGQQTPAKLPPIYDGSRLEVNVVFG